MHSLSGIAHSQQVTPGTDGRISHVLALPTCSARRLWAAALPHSEEWVMQREAWTVGWGSLRQLAGSSASNDVEKWLMLQVPEYKLLWYRGSLERKYLLTMVQRDVASECGLDSATFLLKRVPVLDKVRALLNISIHYLYFAKYSSCSPGSIELVVFERKRMRVLCIWGM